MLFYRKLVDFGVKYGFGKILMIYNFMLLEISNIGGYLL